jgi:hypothetical protein
MTNIAYYIKYYNFPRAPQHSHSYDVEKVKHWKQAHSPLQRTYWADQSLEPKLNFKWKYLEGKLNNWLKLPRR